MTQKIICIDLDGTLAHFEGWKGETYFGNVIDGSKNALQKLKKNNWLIIIFTTRTNKDLITKFLNDNELAFDYINENPHQPANAIGGKPYADVYVDDRAIQFNGNWEKVVSDIENFKSWETRGIQDYESQYGTELLSHDFDQSYQQLRHYDTLNWDITKFSFIELLLGISAVWAIYGFAKDSDNVNTLIAINYQWLIPSIFGVSYIFSLLASFLISRNRVYYAKTARYINEHRKLALKHKPFGFENSTSFYTNTSFPPAFDKWSTQLVCFYVIQLVSAFMFGAMIYCISAILFEKDLTNYLIGIAGGMISIILNFWIYISYMKKKDNKL